MLNSNFEFVLCSNPALLDRRHGGRVGLASCALAAGEFHKPGVVEFAVDVIDTDIEVAGLVSSVISWLRKHPHLPDCAESPAQSRPSLTLN
jgi:hypothetical protein